MAMEYDGKTYRNLQEQVGYLTGKWDDLQDQINDVRSHLTHYVVVDTLPTGDDIDPSAVYLLGPMGTAPDQYYEEWVYVQKADESWMWEKLGDTDSVDLSGYLEKQTAATTYDQVYAKNFEGGQSMIDIGQNNAIANSIVRRTASGQVITATPTANEHAANKKWVDDHKLEKIEGATTYPQAYVKGTDGSQVMLDVTPAKINSAIVRRGTAGEIYIRTNISDGDEAISKAYVENNYLAKQTATSTNPRAYIKNADGSQSLLDVTSATDEYAIVRRSTNGQIGVPTTPTENYHAASKKYVDDCVGQLLYLHEIDLRYTISASITLGIKCYLVNGDSTAITSLTRAIFKRITPSYGALNPDAADTNACAITKMPDTFRQDEFDEPYASFLYQYYSGGSLTSGNTFGITPTVTDVVVSF